jgi:hypothetical protein
VKIWTSALTNLRRDHLVVLLGEDSLKICFSNPLSEVSVIPGPSEFNFSMSARLSIGRLHHRAHYAVRNGCTRRSCGRPVKPIHDPLKSLPFHGRRLRRRSDALTRDFALFVIVQACSPGKQSPATAHDPATPDYLARFDDRGGLYAGLARSSNRARNRRSTGARPHSSVKVGG